MRDVICSGRKSAGSAQAFLRAEAALSGGPVTTPLLPTSDFGHVLRRCTVAEPARFRHRGLSASASHDAGLAGSYSYSEDDAAMPDGFRGTLAFGSKIKIRIKNRRGSVSVTNRF
jgi:hypothetical protein